MIATAVNTPSQNRIVQSSAETNRSRSPSGVIANTPQSVIKSPLVRCVNDRPGEFVGPLILKRVTGDGSTVRKGKLSLAFLFL